MCGDRRPAWNRTADMWETGLGVSPEVRTEKGGILPQAGGSLRLQQTPQKGFVRMELAFTFRTMHFLLDFTPPCGGWSWLRFLLFVGGSVPSSQEAV